MPTIKDVAKRAGVTVTTVSRVLNNRGYIGAETRRKVQQAMRELQYQPNEIARSLYRKRSKIIGIIIPTVSHPFFGELVSHIEGYAYSKGYKILLCNSQLDRTKEIEYTDMLKSNQVEGIIMASHTQDVSHFTDLSLPLVSFDRQIAPDIPLVSSDNYRGGCLAAQLLLDKGCRNLAHICGNLQLDMLANLRHDGFLEVVNGSSARCTTVETGISVFETHQYDQLVRDLFVQEPEVDGIFASGDLQAVHALKMCQEQGRRVPDDVKVVGYDDVYLAALTVPGLSTVRQPLEAMSAQAVDLILAQIEQREVPLRSILPVQLMERETT